MKKSSRNEIRFGKALRNLKTYSKEDWNKFSLMAEAKGKKKIMADSRSVYYGQLANRFKDLKHRINWCKKHPQIAKVYGIRLEVVA